MCRITFALLVLLGITVNSVYTADNNTDLNIERALKGGVDLELNSTDIVGQSNETSALIDLSNGTFAPAPLITVSKSTALIDIISNESLAPSSTSSLAPSSALTSSQSPPTLIIIPVPEDDCPQTCHRPLFLLYFISAECQYEKKTTPGLADITNVTEKGKCVRSLNLWVFILLLLLPLFLIGVLIAYLFRVVKPQIGNGRTFRWCYV
ncbi:hypothetical protein Ddc_14917 [Ditylenchus destructor]|nr:hypothetical protein Ddc_14917 [Ditylenchus destructor]